MYETQRGNGVGKTGNKYTRQWTGKGHKYIRTDGQQTDVTQASRQAGGRHILRQKQTYTDNCTGLKHYRVYFI